MKIGIHTWGSEGDVRPFLALADGLVQAGHDVRLAYSAADGSDYSARLAGARFEHRRFTSPRSPEELRRLGGEIFADANPLRQLSRAIQELVEPVIDEMTQSAAELAKWADVLVSHFLAHPLAAAAELKRKPFVCLHLGPAFATRAFPPSGLPHLGALNALAWKLGLVLISAQQVGSVNRVRAQFGLSPMKRTQQYLYQSAIELLAMSPTLLPRPSDWPEKVHVSGFLTPARELRDEPLSTELEAFLAQGSTPIYVTFGSMSTIEGDQHAVTEMVDRALEVVGCRAIVQSDTPGRSSPNVLRVGATAHELVFPRCAAIVHHGGVGTTQAALRSGRPSVVVAHITDQFMWGRQLHELGVAPPHLIRRTLKPKSLARAIEKALRDTTMRVTAERLGQQMSREDGVRRAVELISLQGAR